MRDAPASLRLQVREFVVNYAGTRGIASVADDEHLFKTNIVDSLGVFRLIAFLEQNFPLTIEDTDIVPENFETIDQITAFVSGKMGGSDMGAALPDLPTANAA
jgi:acyl carrier protein